MAELKRQSIVQQNGEPEAILKLCRTELKGTNRNIIAVYPGGMRTNFWKIAGQSRDTSSFMDPAEVAEKIVNAVYVTDKMFVTDITINRKK